MDTLPYSWRSCFQRTSSGQQIWLFLSFQCIGFSIAFPLLLFPPPYIHNPAVGQIQWYIVGRIFSSHHIGPPLLSCSHRNPRFPSGNCRIWTGSWSCSRWCTALYCAFASLPGIVSGWGVACIYFRSRKSSVSLAT